MSLLYQFNCVSACNPTDKTILIALIKVEKVFNALKKDSIEKVKKKLIGLNYLKLNEDKIEQWNPQTDNSGSEFEPKMENIAESVPNKFETTSRPSNYVQATSSTKNRNELVNEQIKYIKDGLNESTRVDKKAKPKDEKEYIK